MAKTRLPQPLHNRVFVEEDLPPNKTSTGIILPEFSREKPCTGKVIAAGPGQWEHGVFVENSLQKGDRVVYHKQAGYLMTINGVEYLTMRDTEVHAKL